MWSQPGRRPLLSRWLVKRAWTNRRKLKSEGGKAERTKIRAQLEHVYFKYNLAEA